MSSHAQQASAVPEAGGVRDARDRRRVPWSKRGLLHECVPGGGHETCTPDNQPYGPRQAEELVQCESLS